VSKQIIYRSVCPSVLLGSNVFSHSQQEYGWFISIFVLLVLNALLLADSPANWSCQYVQIRLRDASFNFSFCATGYSDTDVPRQRVFLMYEFRRTLI